MPETDEQVMWAVLFDDPGREARVFMGEGAEDAARKSYEDAKLNWSCYLFREIKDATRATPSNPQVRPEQPNAQQEGAADNSGEGEL